MNKTIRDIIFLCICCLLIFNNINTPKILFSLGGLLGSKLLIFPLIIGYIYTLWCQYKYHNIFEQQKKFCVFSILYLAIMLISLLVGIYKFPYFNIELSGPVQQIEKLSMVINCLQSKGIDYDSRELLSVWIVLRSIKSIFCELFWCFGSSYLIYCWYKNDWSNCLKLMLKGCLISIALIIIYSSIEVLYLMHVHGAAFILQEINPYIHVIEEKGKWWPPLLCPNQLRSVFAEPSYFGIFAAFVLPCLWYKLIYSYKKIYIFIIALFSFLLFLTKARTAFMLHLGELFLLIVFTLLYLRNKEYMKRIAVVFLCSIMAFIASNLFITNVMEKTQNVAMTQSITKYVDSNATSLANPDSRSNRARYSVMEADIKIGLEHPLLGVGIGLRDVYMSDYFSVKGLQNKEVQMWMDFQKRLGILKSGYPKLGEYTSRFAETGVLGLICFLVPPFYLLYNLFKKISFLSMKERLPFIMYLISFMGIMASGIGDTLNITYCYWLLLGLGYAMCFGKKYNDKDAYERT